MIYDEGSVRYVVLSETWRLARFLTSAGDCRVPGLLIVVRLRTLVMERTSIMIGFGSGSEILIGITIVVSSMAIGVRMIRMVSSHVVEPVTQICVLERARWIAVSMGGHLGHS